MRSSGKYKWNKQLHAEKNYNRMRNSQVWRRIEILKGWRKKKHRKLISKNCRLSHAEMPRH